MLKKQNNKQILLLQSKNIDKNLLIQNKSSIFAASKVKRNYYANTI